METQLVAVVTRSFRRFSVLCILYCFISMSVFKPKNQENLILKLLLVSFLIRWQPHDNFWSIYSATREHGLSFSGQSGSQTAALEQSVVSFELSRLFLFPLWFSGFDNKFRHAHKCEMNLFYTAESQSGWRAHSMWHIVLFVPPLGVPSVRAKPSRQNS